MDIKPDTIYTGIAILGLLVGPAYILWKSQRDEENDLKERETRRKYMSSEKDLDERAVIDSFSLE